MLSLYEQACEIKKVTGWTQEQISEETGLHLSTVSRIFRMPDYMGNETSYKLIKQLHEETVSSPFPLYIEQLFNLYEDWKEHYTKKEFLRHLNILENLVKHHKELDSIELSACRLNWLLGHIEYDRTFYLKNKPIIQGAETALVWYKKSLNIINLHNNQNLLIQKYKIQQCIVSVKFNCCEQSHRSQSEEIRRWFLEMDYLQLVTEVIKEDSWNWMAARNGLVAASILEDFEKCLFFWNAMINVSKNFKNLNFTPSKNWVSLKEDSDLQWFINQLNKD